MKIHLKAIEKLRSPNKREVILRTWFRTSKLFYYLTQRGVYQLRTIRLRKPSWASIDARLLKAFLDTSVPDTERYSELFSYLVSGLLYYRSPDCAHVYYPGASSSSSADINAMEGICRILPMISVWISSGKPASIKNMYGQNIDLIEIVRASLLAGTNPKSKGFWGDIHDGDQRIVEAADIAISIWLLRRHLWPQLSSREKGMISDWIMSVNGKTIPDNNWHLFPLIVNEVLFSLGYCSDHNLSYMHFERLKSFYKGSGWFSDGPHGEVDYYNAWAIHYSLFWVNLINPGFEHEFIEKSLSDFVQNYKYFISTDGIPITGRSISYRMAAPAPLLVAATTGVNSISPGLARKALNSVWKYFIKQGAVQRGTITQGYFEEDLDLLDNYSGPGSSLWSTRSLVVAFYNPPDSSFWVAPLEDLPIEQSDYEVFIPEIQWEIRGVKLTREVQIVKMNKTGVPCDEMKNSSSVNKFIVHTLGLPYRAEINYSKYQLHKYSSLHPFWLAKPLMY